MKHLLLVAAVTAALSSSPTVDAEPQGAETSGAQPELGISEEFARIRSQLQTLMQRVDRLEAENTALKLENERLKPRTEHVTPRSKQVDTPEAAVIAPEWPNRVAIKGDARYRYQLTDTEGSARREENLLRARMSLDARVNDRIVAGFGVATSSSPGNPRGANVQLDGGFSRKSLYLDFAYFDWTIAGGAHLIGGKMKTPLVRPGQSLFWDNDLNPEGLALTYSAGSMFASAWSYWVEQDVPNGARVATSSDTKMHGLQLGNRLHLGGDTLVVAASYYDLAAAQGRRPFYNDSATGDGAANGNSLNSAGGLAYDYQVVGLMAEYNTTLAGMPLQVWGELAKNLDAEYDTAFTMGTLLGKASSPGSWETGLAYQLLEKDALFAQYIDSDFGAGIADAEGWVLRTGYAPLKNWALSATYFKTVNNKDVGRAYDFDRFMLDFNTRF